LAEFAANAGTMLARIRALAKTKDVDLVFISCLSSYIVFKRSPDIEDDNNAIVQVL
jgi:hypothetical protein